MTAQRLGRRSPKKSKPSFAYAIVSIALILLLVGLLGLTIFLTQKSLKNIKENIEFELVLDKEIEEIDKIQIRNFLNGKPYVKSNTFLSKEEAAENFQKELGQNFIDLLGFNPLYDAYIITLNSNYTASDSIQKIKSELLAHNRIEDVSFDQGIVDLLNSKLKTLSLIILGISIFLLLIAISLIDSTIRLSMFSQRFIIRSMQLIGATQSFIQKPFLATAIKNGILSAILAIGIMAALLIYLNRRYNSLVGQEDLPILAGIFIAVLVLGVLISLFSTFFTVRKYLRLKLDELY